MVVSQGVEASILISLHSKAKQEILSLTYLLPNPIPQLHKWNLYSGSAVVQNVVHCHATVANDKWHHHVAVAILCPLAQVNWHKGEQVRESK